MYTTPLYTSVLKCNGGVARTHVCNQINSVIIEYQEKLEPCDATEVTTHTDQNNHLFLQCKSHIQFRYKSNMHSS